ncbi:hypothetical protein RSAG8_11677, partial [Rhizoctonia solani AG-8 WAC10335]
MGAIRVQYHPFERHNSTKVTPLMIPTVFMYPSISELRRDTRIFVNNELVVITIRVNRCGIGLI